MAGEECRESESINKLSNIYTNLQGNVTTAVPINQRYAKSLFDLISVELCMHKSLDQSDSYRFCLDATTKGNSLSFIGTYNRLCVCVCVCKCKRAYTVFTSFFCGAAFRLHSYTQGAV